MAKHAPLRSYADAYVSALPASIDGVAELSVFSEALSSNPAIKSFLSDVGISKEDRLEALKTISPDAEKRIVSFMLMLGEDGLLDMLDRIIEQVRLSYRRWTVFEYATVTSAIDLTKDERKRITGTLEKRSGKQIRLECRIDPTIIGGLIIQQDDIIINSSIQGRLEHLKRHINV